MVLYQDVTIPAAGSAQLFWTQRILIFAGAHAQRETGRYCPDGSELPGAQQRIGDAAARKAVAFADRQLVQRGRHKTAPRVKDR